MRNVTGDEVLRWPEFRAFVERLGVDVKPSTTCLTVTIPKGSDVRIAMDSRGVCSDVFARERHLPENRYTPDVGMWRPLVPPPPPPPSVAEDEYEDDYDDDPECEDTEAESDLLGT